MASYPHKDGIDIVFGAGGGKGPGEIGAYKALLELGVPIRSITGVSVGNLIAAMATNGMTPDQMADETRRGLNQRNDPALLLKTLTPCDPVSFMVGGPIDMTVPMREMVERLGLKPNNRLQIVACDILTHEPFLFSGENYDLATAMTASCALPSVLRPVWHHGPNQSGDSRLRLLVDGAVYHYNPVDFCQEPAIVFTFRAATEAPRGEDIQSPLDLYFHWREQYLPIAGHRRYVDPVKNVVVEIGLANIAGLNFTASLKHFDEMVEEGYQTTMRIVGEAIKAGRVPSTLVSAD
ncbi:MAG: patatin-like phospholipase family protein [Cyanobacteria bacterium REEB67]|nr:patatin-like phospholipase family protein [Cyanobacteria bacterium REEB67]